MLDRIEAAGQIFSPVDGRDMCLYSPDISTALFQDFLYVKKDRSGWRGARYLTY